MNGIRNIRLRADCRDKKWYKVGKEKMQSNTMALLLCIFFRLVVLKIVFSTKKILDSAGFIF